MSGKIKILLTCLFLCMCVSSFYGLYLINYNTDFIKTWKMLWKLVLENRFYDWVIVTTFLHLHKIVEIRNCVCCQRLCPLAECSCSNYQIIKSKIRKYFKSITQIPFKLHNCLLNFLRFKRRQYKKTIYIYTEGIFFWGGRRVRAGNPFTFVSKSLKIYFLFQ